MIETGNGFEGAILQKGKHTDEQEMVGRILRNPADHSHY